MKGWIRTLSLCLALGCASCGGSIDRGPSDATSEGSDAVDDASGDTTPTDADAAGEDASDATGEVECGTGVFGDACSVDGDCETCLCFEFGDGDVMCTMTCTSDDECPEGSRGRRCNSYGVCRP